jgi:hypothetical protein
MDKLRLLLKVVLLSVFGVRPMTYETLPGTDAQMQ